MVSTTCRFGTGASRVVSGHWVQIAKCLGRAAGAEVAARAREREQVLVRTVVTATTREPVVEHAAGEEPVRDLPDHGAPRAVRAREAVVVDRLQAMQVV